MCPMFTLYFEAIFVIVILQLYFKAHTKKEKMTFYTVSHCAVTALVCAECSCTVSRE